MIWRGFIFVVMIEEAVLGRGPHHPRGEKIAKHHVHYRPSKTAEEKITQDAELLHDKEHLQEHLEDIDLSQMTDEELEFYYFQVHDTDKNSKLDGLEILQAILHTAHEEHPDDDVTETTTNDLDYYINLIDKVLQDDDTDKDGYLSYAEYVSGRRLDEKRNKPSVQIT